MPGSAIQAPGASAFSGAAYLFAKDGNAWSQTVKLVARDGVSGDAFGFSVDVNGGTPIIGAPGHITTAGFNASAAYVYQIEDGKAKPIAELSASDGVVGGLFGSAVAIRNSTVLVGAFAQHPQIDNGPGYPGGEAYTYRLDN